MNQLVNDEDVHVLACALESGVTKTAAQQAKRLQVPFVTSISSSPVLTQQGLKWFFRTGLTDVTYAQSFFGLLDEEEKENLSADRIALLYMNKPASERSDQFDTDRISYRCWRTALS